MTDVQTWRWTDWYSNHSLKGQHQFCSLSCIVASRCLPAQVLGSPDDGSGTNEDDGVAVGA